ncbi:response regulator transcription factor [Pedobacter frigiditerrae]|uniref:Response regulator transcription factor n=1 Tax=Pedobacter frigiditerrae TaxID=2530452 RepID=A0A4R0N1N1_9SPHI|nr:LytTR family DNA-binding domain-containing protein [Pedobacter frigiditerrae]TCC93709.1 response regulator transcription factor [Pedobacter frigiditerrae]
MSDTKRPPYSCYVIDDELHSVEAMTNYVSRVPELSLMGCSTNPMEALREVSEGVTPDIILLDVEMPQISGIDLIERLPKESVIILITGHSKYALDGFEKDVVDFLLKPISFDRFTKAINKAITFLQQTLRLESSLFVNLTGGADLLPIKINSILYIEAQDHRMNICTLEGSHLVKISMKHIQDKLSNEMFVRVHRSFIVNVNHIKTINKSFMLLTGDIKISIGEAYKTGLFELIKQNK